ncbi:MULTISPECIES: hypothetical protein [unclassified Mesorhizobium]|uniref:hypothetical protein n=1 Tax=unclassified Mesorhizobium TaxID=325217 RepID=UPI0013E3052F|nr:MULTISPECIES: hypothetical protein [unclassified Mesorhizobium]
MPISVKACRLAVIHGFGDDVEHAGHFVSDFRGGDAGLIGPPIAENDEDRELRE